MNSLYYIILVGAAIAISDTNNSANNEELFSDYLLESAEVCATEGLMRPAIATCKLDDTSLSFEDKVRLCTIKMRPAVKPHMFK